MAVAGEALLAQRRRFHALYRLGVRSDDVFTGVRSDGHRYPKARRAIACAPPDTGVAFGVEHPPHKELGGGAIRRSRARLRYRMSFGREARLNPVNSDGRPPERDQGAPSLPQIQRFLEWASKAKNRRP